MLSRGLEARRPVSSSSSSGRPRATMAPRPARAAASADGGAGAGAGGGDTGKRGVLMVCLGNICRSPTAEAVFRDVVERRGLADKFEIDSCGTGGGSGNWYKPGGFSYHEGDAADPRMAAAAAKRGVRLTSRSRPLRPEDWKGGRFRHVVCMDQDNVRAVEEAVRYWKAAGLLEEKDGGGAGAPPPRVSLMTDWAPEKSEARRLGKVPDPYYGGPQGFEKVLDLLDEAAEGLLDAVLAEEKEGAAA